MKKNNSILLIALSLCLLLCGFGSAPPSNSIIFNLQTKTNPKFTADQLAKSNLGHLQPGQYCLKLVDLNVPQGIFSGLEMEFELPDEPTYDIDSRLVFTILLPSIDNFTAYSYYEKGKHNFVFKSSGLPLVLTEKDYVGKKTTVHGKNVKPHFWFARETRTKSESYSDPASFTAFNLYIKEIKISDNGRLDLSATFEVSGTPDYMPVKYSAAGIININNYPLSIKFVD